MLYFAYLPKTTIADIIPVIVAGLDDNFVKPCTPRIANDGTLYYDEHEPYVIEQCEHPLKFRSIDWSTKKDILYDFAKQNIFVGNYNDHTLVLQDIPHISITVNYQSHYYPLLVKQAEMFNTHHEASMHIKHLELLSKYDQPVSTYNIDLLELFDETKLIEFMTTIGTYNTQKHKFVVNWLDKIKNNLEFSKILLDISAI